MQNIADFVEKKGGGVAFIAGPLYTPLAYRHTPLAELLPVDLETATPPTGDASGAITEGFRVVPTELGLASPQMQLGDQRRRDEANLGQPAQALLAAGNAGSEAGRPGAGRTSHAAGCRRPQAGGLLAAICRRRQGAVPRHRRHLALALSRGRRLLLALLDPDDPLSQPLEAAGQGPLGRTDDRPPPISSRRGGAAFASGSPTSGWLRPTTTA